MGTVGISFGSPTGGVGFDVSSTVSQIVANLQNVETPWKTQLTSLQAQDTAISSLGSLLSALSNDIGGLTDFTGVLAAKEGSSSDPSVLALTSSSSSAVAGTHTIVVNSLAATASGYLDSINTAGQLSPIANASDTLAGSITLAVGSATPTVINLASLPVANQNLAGLAAAINTAAVGVSASVITNASGSSLWLAPSAGQALSVTSAVTDGGAALSYTPPSPAGTLTGSISIAVGSAGAHTITLDSTDGSLSGLAAAINSAGIGVSAGVVTDANGSRLSLVSGTSGGAGNLTVTSTIEDGATSLAYNSAVTGVDASLTVDGISVSNASNTVSTVIPGVTFQLLAPSPVTGTTPETVQVQIVNDNAAVVSSVGQFVSDYNAVVSAVNLQETNSSSGSPEPLFGSPILTQLQEQILGAINSTSPPGALTAIANASDTLAGSISIAASSGTPPVFGSPTVFSLSSLPAANQNLAGLAAAINTAAIGVVASVTTADGESSLSLAPSAYGQTLNVTSAVTDGSAALTYTPPSDVNGITTLGLGVNNDGTLSLDSTALTSELNSDYSGVVNFFQNSNSWGVGFSNTLYNLGTSNVVGSLALALSSDSSIESSLNLNITNENTIISAQQTSLTLELTSANEILQAIPSEIDNINELYSSITGYQAPTG